MIDLTLVHGDPHESPSPLNGAVLVFTHVPKAAGTTLDLIFLAAARAFRLKRWRATGSLYGQFLGEGKGEALDRFADLPPGERAGLDLLVGHLPFGVHQHLDRRCLYLTLIREPVERCLSHYRFGLERGGWKADEPIERIFDSGRIADNAQVRQLAGQTDPSDRCDASTLRKAERNLRDDYALVGTMAGFDVMLAALITLLDWPDVAYRRAQVQEVPPDGAGLRRLVDPIRRRNELDLELYSNFSAVAPLIGPAWGKAEGRTRTRSDQVLIAATHETPEDPGDVLKDRKSFAALSLMIRARGGVVRRADSVARSNPSPAQRPGAPRVPRSRLPPAG